MKKPSKKKEVLISGIVGALLLTGGLYLAICVDPNGAEKFLYDATGMMLDINGDGKAVFTHVDGITSPFGDESERDAYETFVY